MAGARADAVLAAVLSLAVGVAAGVCVWTLDPHFLDPATGKDVWFEGDLGRIADEMTHRWAAHSRAPVHPLFSLVTVSAVYALRAAGASPLSALAAVAGLSAAVWTAACYVLFRALGTRPLDACLFVALTVASASGLFWLTVPETATLGSASVLAAVALAAYTAARPVREAWFVAAAAASLSITVTNVAAGLAAAFSRLRWRRALQVSINAFALVVVLWAAQRLVVAPRGDFFIGYSNEQRYLLRPEAGGPANAVKVLVLDGMMMPTLSTTVKPGRGPIMTVQRSAPARQGWLWSAGAALWIAMIGYGLWVVVTTPARRAAYAPLLGVVLFEAVLYGIYGTETFLYTLNVVPLLAGVAAGGLSGAARPLVRAGGVALLTLALVNNATRWREARAYFTPAVAARTASMFAPTSVPSSAAFLYGLVDER